MTVGKTIIEMRALTKRYGEVTAVDHLTLDVRQGEIFGLLGPNGAGKTTTTLMLLGLTEPTEGSAAILGVDCTRDPIRIKRSVGYLPDNMGFYPDMTGRENLRMTGRMNGLSEKELEGRIESLVRRVGMAEAVDRKTGTYSKGMKQRLGIADILMKDPEVLIMDEPTNSIDPEGMRELMVLIRELAEKDGRTILISSHQLHQIQQICDRVGIFVSGSLVACGEIGELGKQIEQEAGYCFEVGADPGGERLLERLLSFEGVREAKLEEDICVVRAAQDMRGQIARELSGEGFALTHLRRRGGDLDEIYAKYFEKAGEKHAGKRENGKPGARRRA